VNLSYEQYLDKVLGGWIGKSMGGAVGTRFEGYKGWIEIDPADMFPAAMPPNDDLDLQVLWLKVLEEKGPALTSDDLAQAWLDGCWYPFNEYGIFRRNWRLGIHPPMSGRFGNQFWENGMGCPIRAEIWGYVFPGAPDLAAHYAVKDGTLDHTEQSVGAEMMLAAMSSMAFFVSDVRRLAAMFIHYLPAGTPIARMTRAAFDAYDQGVPLRAARDRIMAMEGFPEACDSQVNVPFTFLGLLYGGNDLQETMLAALRCGYDTDCTLATAAALLGQILGASRIPAALKEAVGDELVMGIEYRRAEMTLTALARDTARVGVLINQTLPTGVTITGAPAMAAAPPAWTPPPVKVSVEYAGLPTAAPGETVQVTVAVRGLQEATHVTMRGPEGWTIVPDTFTATPGATHTQVALYAPVHADAWPMRQLFHVRVDAAEAVESTFGIAGSGLWRFLGVYYDALPEPENVLQRQRRFMQHFVSLQRAYLPEPVVDVEKEYQHWSHALGRPAVIYSRENEVDLSQLIGLRGPYCAYLTRTLFAREEQTVYFVIGNNDGYRLYLNGELVHETEECLWWTPFNNIHPVTLREGANHIVVKLLKRGDDLRFTFGVRARTGAQGQNAEDWVVDLSDDASFLATPTAITA